MIDQEFVDRLAGRDPREVLGQTADRLDQVLARLTKDQLDRERPFDRTLRDVVYHMVNYERINYGRLRGSLSAVGKIVPYCSNPYDLAFIETWDGTRTDSERFRSLRARLLGVIDDLTSEELGLVTFFPHERKITPGEIVVLLAAWDIRNLQPLEEAS